MTKYRKKPVVIEAILWTGSNWQDIQDWGCKSAQTQDDELWIPTLEGVIKAPKGDYIIKGVKGEFYPCKPNVFESTYEKV